jgi:transposase
MNYYIAGIDVHKKMLAVVVADMMTGPEDYKFERLKTGTTPDDIRELAQWLVEHEVREVVMESTAQYWKPVWEGLERHWKPKVRSGSAEETTSGLLHLAQAKSNRGPRGRKNDFGDAKRLVKRLVADELILSFVPDEQQRLWRTVTRKKRQLLRDKVRLRNQLEGTLEEAHIKLSGVVSDLLGLSGRRMLLAIAQGETRPEALAKLAHHTLQASPEQLSNALCACGQMHQVYRRMIQLAMEELDLLDRQMAELGTTIATLLAEHHDAVKRLAEVPGLGPESAQQIIAEIGPEAKVFGSAKELASWVGVCPGEEQSADKAGSTRSPKGNRVMRGVLNQAAHAAVKMKGSIFEVAFSPFAYAHELSEGYLGRRSPDLPRNMEDPPRQGCIHRIWSER